MNQDITIRLNNFALEQITMTDLLLYFNGLEPDSKSLFFSILVELILQSKCLLSDIDLASRNAGIKQTSNCCMIARKGMFYHNLKRLADLNEKNITLMFMANLFKIGYRRRKLEPSSSTKWWYENSLL